MEEQHKHIDELFREQLGNYTEAPPPMAWNAIEKKLDQNGRQKRMLPWWPLLVLMLLGSTVTGYLVVENKLFDTKVNGSTMPGSTTEQNSNYNNTEKSTDRLNTATNNNDAAANKGTPGNTNGITTGSNDNSPGATGKNSIGDNTATNANTVNGDHAGSRSQSSSTQGPEHTSSAPGGRRSADRNPASNNSRYADGGKKGTNIANTTPIGMGTINNKQGNRTRTNTAGRNVNGQPLPINNRSNSNGNSSRNNPARSGGSYNDDQANTNSENDKPANGSLGTTTTGGGRRQNRTGYTQTSARKNDPYNAANGPNEQNGGKNDDNSKKPLTLAGANDGGKKPLNLHGANEGSKKAVNLNAVQEGVKKNKNGEDTDPGYTLKKQGQKNSPDGGKAQRNANGNSSDETDGDAGYTVAKSKPSTGQIDANSSVKKVASDLPKPPRDPRDGIPIADYLNSNFGEKNKPGTETDGDDAEDADPGNKNEVSSGGGGGGATASSTPKKKTSFEGGIKLGYERGLKDYTAAKEVVEIFAQFNISKKVVLMVQPTIKFAKTNNNFSFEGGYYNITSQTHSADSIPGQGTYKHHYQEYYDSFHVKRSFEQKYTEFDIPIIFKYMIDKNLAMFAGLNISIGKILKIQEEKTALTSYSRVVNDSMTTTNIGLPFDTVFPHSGSPTSTYNANDYVNATSNPLRFGYMFGLSYEVKQRFLIDVMVQQNLAGQTYIPNKDIRSIYTQPYFRLSIGYKLFGNKKITE